MRVRAREGLRAVLLLAGVLSLPPALPAQQARAAVDGKKATEPLLGNFSLGNRHDPISIRAKTVEFSYRDGVLTYTGGVVVTQGDLTLKSDKLVVTLADANASKLQQIRAEGDVTITKGTRSASGGKAVFDERDRTVQLTDNAVLIDGPNRISGEKVVVYLDEERSVIEGGDHPVEAVLYPNSDELRGKGQGAPGE